MRRSLRILPSLLAFLCLGASAPQGLGAQAAAAPASPPVDSTGLASGPFSTMEMLFEATIFNVDVFTLRLVVDDVTRDRLQGLAAGREWSRELEAEMAAAVMEARDALVTTSFRRDVGLDRFLEGLEQNLRKAREAGLVSREEEVRILSDSGEQYAPLRGRGLRSGDTLRYRIRGDSVRVAFHDRDGAVLGGAVRVGPERRVSLLASYMAPGSDFREKLLRPLVEGSGR